MNDFTFSPPAEVVLPRRPLLPVLVSGLATSVLALVGVWSINKFTNDFNVMGWYVWYVVPAGALFVGALSAAGYGLGSWFSGVKIGKGLLWTVLGLQLVAYLAAQYLSFTELTREAQASGYVIDLNFFQWFDQSARSFAWKESGGHLGEPLGAWGYLFRLLEIAGFALGGAYVPLMLSSKPYCDACQRYRRALKQVILPLGTLEARPLADGTQEPVDAAMKALDELRELARADRLQEYRALLGDLRARQKSFGKSKRKLHVLAHICPGCSDGYLAPRILEQNGQQVAHVELAQTPFSRDFGHALLSR